MRYSGGAETLWITLGEWCGTNCSIKHLPVVITLPERKWKTMKKILYLFPGLFALLLLSAAQPFDLGLITDRVSFELKPGRSDVLRFELTAQPANMSNTIKFTLTNRLVQAKDMPLPNGPGLLVVRTEWSDGSYSRPTNYVYNLFKGIADGPGAQRVGIIVPDQTGVVERAIEMALRLPVVPLPPMPPGAEQAVRSLPLPLPDAAAKGMRQYYERSRRGNYYDRSRRNGSAVTNAPRSQIRRFPR